MNGRNREGGAAHLPECAGMSPELPSSALEPVPLSTDRRLRRVPTCRSCGKELPGEFPFCPFCGGALTAEPAAPVQEERKIVTVLFCDLVGFTAASEAADPEDVRASPQATRADRKRIKELERDLLRKDRALAETAALLVLSKKVAAIFNKGEDE